MPMTKDNDPIHIPIQWISHQKEPSGLKIQHGNMAMILLNENGIFQNCTCSRTLYLETWSQTSIKKWRGAICLPHPSLFPSTPSLLYTNDLKIDDTFTV